MVASLHEPRYWEFRSEEIRALAAEFSDRRAIEIMLRIAADYERLAELLRRTTPGQSKAG